MKQCQADVKSKSKVVGKANYPEYDSVAEAIEKEGEATILGVINTQVKTRELNLVRNQATGVPSKKVLRERAFTRISRDELLTVIGDAAAYDRLIEEKIKLILAEIEAARPELPEEEDDDE